eukprot:Trichotokara_eunicae@DN5489_c0_g1_i1.p1
MQNQNTSNAAPSFRDSRRNAVGVVQLEESVKQLHQQIIAGDVKVKSGMKPESVGDKCTSNDSEASLDTDASSVDTETPRDINSPDSSVLFLKKGSHFELQKQLSIKTF